MKPTGSVDGEFKSSSALASDAVGPSQPLSVNVETASKINQGNTPSAPSPWSSSFQSFESSLAKGHRRKMSMSRSEYYKQNATLSDVAENVFAAPRGKGDSDGQPKQLLSLPEDGDNTSGRGSRFGPSKKRSPRETEPHPNDVEGGSHVQGQVYRLLRKCVSYLGRLILKVLTASL